MLNWLEYWWGVVGGDGVGVWGSGYKGVSMGWWFGLV